MKNYIVSFLIILCSAIMLFNKPPEKKNNDYLGIVCEEVRSERIFDPQAVYESLNYDEKEEETSPHQKGGRMKLHYRANSSFEASCTPSMVRWVYPIEEEK